MMPSMLHIGQLSQIRRIAIDVNVHISCLQGVQGEGRTVLYHVFRLIQCSEIFDEIKGISFKALKVRNYFAVGRAGSFFLDKKQTVH
jgi:hypothetical protein